MCGTGKITISSSWQQLWLHHALNCMYIHEYVAFMFLKEDKQMDQIWGKRRIIKSLHSRSLKKEKQRN